MSQLAPNIHLLEEIVTTRSAVQRSPATLKLQRDSVKTTQPFIYTSTVTFTFHLNEISIDSLSLRK